MADIDYKYIVRGEDLPPIAEELLRVDVYGLDIETAGKSLHPMDGKIRLVQLHLPTGIYIVDLFQIQDASVLFDALRSTNAVAVGFNLKFEQKWFLYHHNVVLKRLFCAFRASNLIYNGNNLRHDLYSVLARELNLSPPVEDRQMSDWSSLVLTKDQLSYAAFDVQPLFQLREVLKKKLAKWGLNRVALIEFNAILPEASVELHGMPLDREMWTDLAKENHIKAEALRKELIKELPNPSNQLTFPGIDPQFNLNSPVQLVKSLNKLGVRTDSTREIFLAPYIATFPILQKLFDYREFSKSVSSFGADYLDYIHPVTERIHCDFYPFTAAGRYATSNPNLGQVPRDKRFRRCFRTKPGRKFIIVDYAGIEMRGAAQLSRDQTLLNIFKSGKDVHRATAAIILKKPESDVTKEERQKAKSCNFGYLYGMGAEKFILYAAMNYKATFSLTQSKQFRSAWLDAYSGIYEWQREVVEEGKRQGYSRTSTGRIRHYEKPDEVYSEFMNTPIQGCLPSSSRVLTDRGYITIKECQKEEKRKCWTGSSWADFSVISKGIAKKAAIKFSDGNTLDCDDRHKSLVVADSGYDWVDFDHLKPGLRVAVSPVRLMEFDSPAPLPEFKFNNRAKHHCIVPNNVDKELWYWLGRYYGDGWFSECNKNISFAFGSNERELRDVIRCQRFWSRFGFKSNYTVAKHKPKFKESVRVRVDVYSTELYAWLSEIGLTPSTAHTKRLFSRVYGETILNRLSFLKGFMDSDGYMPDPLAGEPNLHLCNKDLLLDVRLLLRTVGVESVLRGPYDSEGFISWRLDVHSKMLRRALAYLHGATVPIEPKINMPAPAFLIDDFLNKYYASPFLNLGRQVNSTIATLVSRMRRGGKCSIYTLQRLFDLIGSKPSVPIYAHRTLKEVIVHPDSDEMYTLSVDDPMHRFDAEGVICKNSCTGDGIKVALKNVYDRMLKYNGRAFITHHVHDEIVTECEDDPDLLKTVLNDVQEGMKEAMSGILTNVPIEVEGGIGSSWAEK